MLLPNRLAHCVKYNGSAPRDTGETFALLFAGVSNRYYNSTMYETAKELIMISCDWPDFLMNIVWYLKIVIKVILLNEHLDILN